jgi:hypothetical protein
MDSGRQEEAFHMVPADIQVADIQVADIQAVDIQVADIQVADIHQVAVHNLVVGCYKDQLAEVVMEERSHHTDLAD